MTPWELRERVAQLRDNWNLLRAQVIGRKMQARTDINPAAQQAVILGYGNFRKWYQEIQDKPFKEMFGLFESQYIDKRKKYEAIRKRALRALPKSETMKAESTPEPDTPLGTKISGVLILALGVVLFMMARPERSEA
jgi:hypothetical protein